MPITVALIQAVSPANDDSQLRTLLEQARSAGALLALLPELPLNPWSPATKEARDGDAEEPGGPRHQRQARLASEVGIALVGGAIVRDPGSGLRFNTALAFDRKGLLCGTHRKMHLPEEPGFWETTHYEPGDVPPRPFRLGAADGAEFHCGLQICSDVNRPDGTYQLVAGGAQAILAPRATERATWDRWRLVLTANALTSATYVLSANRPGPENGVELGGPSLAVGPDGKVLLETEDPLGLVTLDPESVSSARRAYPGYLPYPAGVYAAGWSELG